MSLLAMPMIVLNLGAEMMFILEQRLKAQSIATDKAGKVLVDVGKTMFDRAYMDKLFTPQELYSVASVRKIFDRLAHSSIMRLSESSMDKLFDLMMMGFKYQLVCSTKLEGMLQVTRLHLAQLRAMLSGLEGSGPVLEQLAHAEASCSRLYAPLGAGALHLLRQTLLRFFQDKRVKVSLFLQEGIQSPAGRLLLVSPACSTAGTVTYYDGSGGVEVQERVKLKALESLDPTEFFLHPAPLGSNLYNKDRPKVTPPPRKGDVLQAPLSPHGDASMAVEGGGRSQYAEDVLEASGAGSGAKQELGLLSALLAIRPQADNFKLNLFDSADSWQVGQRGDGAVKSYKFEGGGYKQGMLASLKLDDKDPAQQQQQQQDGEDLLDLLDSAA